MDRVEKSLQKRVGRRRGQKCNDGLWMLITVVKRLDYQLRDTITILRHRQSRHDNYTSRTTLIAYNLLPDTPRKWEEQPINGRGNGQVGGTMLELGGVATIWVWLTKKRH